MHCLLHCGCPPPDCTVSSGARASGGDARREFRDTQLDRARAAVTALVEAHPGTSVEDKGRTIAVHFRMAPQHEAGVRRSLIEIAKPLGSNYHIQEGQQGVGDKTTGFTKAGAIKAFMREPPFSGRKPVFVGDDLTDQDGFKAVEDPGWHLHCGRRSSAGAISRENAAAVA